MISYLKITVVVLAVIFNLSLFSPVHGVVDGFLCVRSSQIVNSSGVPIDLKGLTLTNGVYTVKSIQIKEETEYFPKRTDYLRLKEIGTNVVRYYLQYYWVMGEGSERFFRELDLQIAMAREAGIYIILNLHYFGVSWDVNSGKDDGFFRNDHDYDVTGFWKKISDRYKNEPVIAGYELLNEPTCHDGFTERDLYYLYKKIISRIRGNADRHLIFISDPVNKFEAPDKRYFVSTQPFVLSEDTDIVYTFHWYRPFPFTHQTCYYYDFMEIGADYPFLQQDGTFVDRYIEDKSISSTRSSWQFFQGNWIDTSSVDWNREGGLQTAGFSIELLTSFTDGVIWFDDISLERRNKLSGKIEQVPIKNPDVSRPRTYYSKSGKYIPSQWPMGWYGYHNSNTEQVIFAWDETQDHTGNGSGSLVIDTTRARWSGSDVYAVWSQNGGTRPVFYPADDEHQYRVSGWIKTRDNFTGKALLDLSLYQVDEELIDREYLREKIVGYYGKWASANSAVVMCTEFGLTDPSLIDDSFPLAPAQQSNWITDMVEIFEEAGIHWTYHTYKQYSGINGGSFGLFDVRNENFSLQNTLKYYLGER